MSIKPVFERIDLKDENGNPVIIDGKPATYLQCTEIAYKSIFEDAFKDMEGINTMISSICSAIVSNYPIAVEFSFDDVTEELLNGNSNNAEKNLPQGIDRASQLKSVFGSADLEDMTLHMYMKNIIDFCVNECLSKYGPDCENKLIETVKASTAYQIIVGHIGIISSSNDIYDIYDGTDLIVKNFKDQIKKICKIDMSYNTITLQPNPAHTKQTIIHAFPNIFEFTFIRTLAYRIDESQIYDNGKLFERLTDDIESYMSQNLGIQFLYNDEETPEIICIKKTPNTVRNAIFAIDAIRNGNPITITDIKKTDSTLKISFKV